jgi:hypothetical protein
MRLAWVGQSRPATIDLDPLLRFPRLWVGNAELARFAGEGLLLKPRRGDITASAISVDGCIRSGQALLESARQGLDAARKSMDHGPVAIHFAASLLLAAQGEEAPSARPSGEALTRPATGCGPDQVFLLRGSSDAQVEEDLILLVTRDAGRQAAGIIRTSVDPNH